MYIGVDTGGTFTDLVLFERGRFATYKLPSTPSNFAEGVLKGIQSIKERNAFEYEVFQLTHSTTVATNALLEKKGSKTGLIITKGFRDVLAIGRQARSELYNLHAQAPEPLVPRKWRKEIDERVSAEGKILVSPDPEEIQKVLDLFRRSGVDSIAICFLFSFLKPQHEKLVARMARKMGFTVSCSSEILPEFREFERCSTTVANSMVAPIMTKYLKEVAVQAQKMGAESFRVVSSGGGTLNQKEAGSHAVQTLLSGPAAGVTGAISLAQQAFQTKTPKLITFDMGGTSTDVALVDGVVEFSSEHKIGSSPISIPMMDIHTVGAGGGSVAFVDGGGALHVGPESAGARPGPACYGFSELPTVSDANCFLGRLSSSTFCGGEMPLYPERAVAAMEKLAEQMQCSAMEAAEGIVTLVNARMERAIRVISLDRGHDPRDFTLVSFGGAGGLHACSLAESLAIPRVMLPLNPGVISAWGALNGCVRQSRSLTVMKNIDAKSFNKLHAQSRALVSKAERALNKDGVKAKRRSLEVSAHYKGQSFELLIPLYNSLQRTLNAFHDAHKKRFGFDEVDRAVIGVTLRVTVEGQLPAPQLSKLKRRPRGAKKLFSHAKQGGYSLIERDRLAPDDFLKPHTLVVEQYSTSLIPKGWIGRVDSYGHILCELES